MIERNAACYQLLGNEIAGCKGHHFSFFLDRIGPRCSGPFLPLHGVCMRHLCGENQTAIELSGKELRPVSIECRFQSPTFGQVFLKIFEIPTLHPTTGNYSGSFLNIEFVSKQQEIEKAIEQRLADELMWEAYAPSYDRILPHLPFYTECVARHLEATSKAGKIKILDIGSGTGIATKEMLDFGHSVTAVEPNRAMLRCFNKKRLGNSTGGLTLIEDTAEKLPHLSDESFDAVTGLLAFFAIQDPYTALDEAKRLLRSGGTLIITEPSAKFDANQLLRKGQESLEEQRLLPRLEKDWKKIQSVAPNLSRMIRNIQSCGDTTAKIDSFSAESIYEHFIENGYHDVAITPSHAGNCATITAIKP